MKLYGRLLAWFLLGNLATAIVTLHVGGWLIHAAYGKTDARRDAAEAVHVFEAGGSSALQHWLEQKRQTERLFGVLLDQDGRPLVPLRFRLAIREDGPLPSAALPAMGQLEPAPRPAGHVSIGFRTTFAPLRQVVDYTSASGARYRWQGSRLPPGHWLPVFDVALRLLVGLIILGAVALLAARHLLRPIYALRQATERFASGDLATRAGDAVIRRRDELGSLARAFDHMAARIARLVETQQQLLRDVSHELRSPLARLRVAAELAREHSQPQHFDRIEQEADRLNALIDHVLTLARLDASEEALADVRLDQLLADICADTRFELQARGIRLQAQLEENCSLRAREQMLRAAFENVIRNAVRYTADTTTVEVTLAREAAGYAVRVCDRGPGVPAEALENIFEPFVRISAARERESGGYGLGLAIARRALLAHGGRIGAALRTGGGLCVAAWLPQEGPATSDVT